jgi:hypothetical protein
MCVDLQRLVCIVISVHTESQRRLSEKCVPRVGVGMFTFLLDKALRRIKEMCKQVTLSHLG